MAGFKRNVDIEIEGIDTDIDIDEDYYDDDIDDVIDDVIPSRNHSKSPNNENDEDDENVTVVRRKKKSKNVKDDKNIIYVVAGVAVAIIVVGTIMFFVSSNKKKEQEALIEQQQQEQQNINNSNSNSEVSPGIPSFVGIGAYENDEYLYDPSLITKDLNGNQVPPNYEVLGSETVTDYINYKKFRAPTGNGLEFYWLEAEYKGQPYKVQVPYSVYSKLDDSGITVVDMEVLELDNKSKMVTYMKVREDAKSLLEDR